MKFKVLGCSGSRQPGHNLTSYSINDRVIVDAGALCGYLDLDAQLGITDVLVSHANLDHTKDILFLADNIVGAVAEGRRGPVLIRSQMSVLASIRRHLLNDDIWPDFSAIPSPENPTLALDPVEFGVPFEAAGLNVVAFPVPHSAGSTGFVLYGDDPAENVAITGDTGPNGAWTTFINEMDFPVTNLVVECSFPNELEDLARLSDHLTPRLLHEMVDKLVVKPKLYITHIKAMHSNQVQEQLQQEFTEYSYQLPRKGDVFTF